MERSDFVKAKRLQIEQEKRAVKSKYLSKWDEYREKKLTMVKRYLFVLKS
jgi:hypothetical protein